MRRRTSSGGGGKGAGARPRAAPGPGPELSVGILPELLGYRLRRAQRAVYDSFRAVVGAREDITPGLFGMAQVIAANPGLNQSRLADAMGVDRSTIVTVIHALEARGLVERTGSRSDGRANALQVTPGGRVALRRIEALIRRHEAEVASLLSTRERRTLMDLLAKLYGRGAPASP